MDFDINNMGLMFTAIESAYSRAQTKFPYASEMWDAIVAVQPPKFTVEQKEHCRQTERDIRSEVMRDAIIESKFQQYLELGSGFSTQGLAFCKENPDAIYIEMLLPVEAKQKRAVLNQMARDPRVREIPMNLHIVAGNALELESFEQAAQYFDYRKPVGVVNVAVMKCFTMLQKELFAQNIKRFLGKFGGSWLSFDLRGTPNANTEIRDRLNKQTGLAWTSFESDEEVVLFLDKIGLKSNLLEEHTHIQRLRRLNIENMSCKCVEASIKIDNVITSVQKMKDVL
jgi:hypothetical protein